MKKTSTRVFSGILIAGLIAIFAGSVIGAVAATKPSELATRYLLEHQNADGSWGGIFKQFIITAAVLDALHAVGETGSQYDKSIAWIESYITDNNDFLAQQVKQTIRAGAPTSSAEYLAYALDESTGGFRFDRGYEADLFTTAQVLESLTVADYRDPSANPKITVSLVLYYLARTQRSDGGWGAFDGAPSDSFATAKALNSLAPYQAKVIRHIADRDISVDRVIQKGLSFLRKQQQQDGLWNENMVTTLSAFRIMKKFGQDLQYRDAAVSAINNAQDADGGFGGDLYLTATAIPVLRVIETP